ncbi:MAG: hypothetical protein Q8P95_02100 [bacterium]|nr:hypothetical protein [bacterium]
MWYLLSFILLLILGVCVLITLNKVKREIYNPYYLRHVLAGSAFFGVLFLALSLYFLFQL